MTIGYLDTNLDLNVLSKIMGFNIKLPNKQFKLVNQLKSFNFNTSEFKTKEELEQHYNKKIFNIALVYKNSGIVSFM